MSKKTSTELQAELDALQAEKTEVEKVLATFPGPGDGSIALPEGERLASDATPEEIERARVLRDPYAGENFLDIKANPPGKELRWISPESRKRRGMRGWTVVRFDDAIGRELHKYINDPPSRYEGSSNMDAEVRRGDVVLAWIDVGIAEKRRQVASMKANRFRNSGAMQGSQRIGQFGQIVGDGLRDDPNPQYRAARGMVLPKDYRKRTADKVTDPAIRVEGRRLFGEPEQE